MKTDGHAYLYRCKKCGWLFTKLQKLERLQKQEHSACPCGSMTYHTSNPNPDEERRLMAKGQLWRLFLGRHDEDTRLWELYLAMIRSGLVEEKLTSWLDRLAARFISGPVIAPAPPMPSPEEVEKMEKQAAKMVQDHARKILEDNELEDVLLSLGGHHV